MAHKLTVSTTLALIVNGRVIERLPPKKLGDPDGAAEAEAVTPYSAARRVALKGAFFFQGLQTQRAYLLKLVKKLALCFFRFQALKKIG